MHCMSCSILSWWQARLNAPEISSPNFMRNMLYDDQRVMDGLKLMVWGFFKKVVIADKVALIVEPGLSRSHPVYGSSADCRGSLFRHSSLLRFFRLFGYCHRRRPGDGFSSEGQFQQTFPFYFDRRILEKVAYVSHVLVSGLCLYSAGRKPSWEMEMVF